MILGDRTGWGVISYQPARTALEIWVAVAPKAGVEEIARSTYVRPALMLARVDILLSLLLAALL